MAVIRYTDAEVSLLARLMRAEAEGEGKEGMLMVGNVCVNRVLCDCLDFRDIRSITDMVYQNPGGFEAVQKSYFYQRARDQDIELSRRVIAAQRFWPATYGLWFFRPAGSCPGTWFNQKLAGRFKSHCFYQPTAEDCPKVYSV
ncbi:cell wall hydrolase [Gottfriedia acidiceleris]|uniref:cell wall hydrolase n=1 Tax=Gottfriedia acidiceleris TaxID=371036 RepID=UPI00101B8136|nr:cell wall hydrolase [Gottfriedia acidiceleris]